jgi:hypothetical protein
VVLNDNPTVFGRMTCWGRGEKLLGGTAGEDEDHQEDDKELLIL